MEALTAASIACLTIYDMAKAVDRGMAIAGIRLVREDAAANPATIGARAAMAMALLPVDEALARLLAAPRRSASEIVRACRRRWPRARRAAEGAAHPAALPGFGDGRLCRARRRILPAGAELVGHRRLAGRSTVLPARSAAGQAVRIFTGAPVPAGADTVLIQENARHLDARRSQCSRPSPPAATSAGPASISREGDDAARTGVAARRRRAVARGCSEPSERCRSFKRPQVAILATGDELLPPGSTPGPDQIIASNTYGVAAIARDAGAEVVDLGIVRDHKEEIAAPLGRRARRRSADILVTLGGASVGDHDLVHAVLTARGHELDFWKIAMRPASR